MAWSLSNAQSLSLRWLILVRKILGDGLKLLSNINFIRCFIEFYPFKHVIKEHALDIYCNSFFSFLPTSGTIDERISHQFRKNRISLKHFLIITIYNAWRHRDIININQ